LKERAKFPPSTGKKKVQGVTAPDLEAREASWFLEDNEEKTRQYGRVFHLNLKVTAQEKEGAREKNRIPL